MSFSLATDTAFPLHCELTADYIGPPYLAVSRTDMMAEVAEELRYRRSTYPKRISLGRMNQGEADRQIAIFTEIAAELPSPGNDHSEPDPAFSWSDKVNELRREITMRRQLYPRWIDSPQSPLTKVRGCLRMARLEAVHEIYWYLCCFSGIDRDMAARILDTRHEQRAANQGIAPWEIIAPTGNPQRKLI